MLLFFNFSQVIVVYAAVLLFAWLVYRKRKGHRYKFIFIAILALYLLFLVKYTLFRIITGGFYPDILFSQQQIINLQLIPGHTIYYMLSNGNWLIQLLGNVILLLPVPIFIGFMRKEWKIGKILLFSVLVSPCIEVIQLLENLIVQYPNRSVDVDDVLLNVIGIVIGTVCFYLLKNKAPRLYLNLDSKIVSACEDPSEG